MTLCPRCDFFFGQPCITSDFAHEVAKNQLFLNHKLQKNFGVCSCDQLNLHFWFFFSGDILPFNARMDKASAIETVESGSIFSRIEPTAAKIGTHSFPA